MSVGWDIEKKFWPRTKNVAAQRASFLSFKKTNYFDLFTPCFGIFVTFYKINKMMLSIIISTLKGEKVHFK